MRKSETSLETAAAAENIILSKTLMREWVPSKHGHFGGGGNVTNLQERSFLIIIHIPEHSRTSRTFQ